MVARHAAVAARLTRRYCSAAGSGRTLLAAVVERPPVVTPDTPAWEQKQLDKVIAAEAKHKIYPEVLTDAEEGPDRQRARLRMEALVEREGSREGEGDRTGDLRSLDRRLAQRLYLLVEVDGRWQFPQATWAPPEAAREGVLRGLAERCGPSLEVHRMGNAPLGHFAAAEGTTFFWRLLHVAGEVEPAEGTDFAWLTKAEIGEKLEDEKLGELTQIMCGPFD